MNRSSLATNQLSAAVQRAVASGAGKAMASRGLVPLPPGDQVAVLYQLSIDSEVNIANQARATARGLPDRLLATTLADPCIDPRVLDLFAELALGRRAVVDAIVLNPVVGDETLAMIASKGSAHDIDLIAQNEQRLLRFPEIVTAMYLNRRGRMSTIDRIVELAVRNNVRVPRLAAWDEIARALHASSGGRASAEADDALMAMISTEDDRELITGTGEDVIEEEDLGPETAEEKKKTFDEASIPAQIRAATLGNAQDRARAIRSPVKLVAAAAVKSPGVTDIEVVRWAGNPNLGEDVIRHIASQRDWTKMYGVKVSLCRNPKTPIPDAIRFMPFLREKDLRNLARSRGVPTAVVSSARKLLMQRSGKT
jgi:hypothetical protein